MQNRRCVLCQKMSPQHDMTLIRSQRFEVLHRWYPNTLKSPEDRAHKLCLSRLGLFPFPKDGTDIAQIMGTRVFKRIEELIKQFPEVQGTCLRIRQFLRMHVMDRASSFSRYLSV